tara:strand:- start:354 stop:1118 length:765 start_codon:yes stop_codon:yes gene_type:complete
MKIYFNANNKATLEALERCGVKNVLLSHRYSYANINKFNGRFDSIFIVPGTKGNPDKYREFLKKKKEYYDYATQFDVFYNMDETLKYLEKERKDGIDWTLPILQENYLQHISRLRPKTGDYICIGEVHGKLETEDQIRKLPQNVEYHGLAKGKYIEKRPFKSLDTSAWISAAMSKKTEVWSGNSTFSLFFGEKGRGMKSQVASTLERFSEYLEIVGISSKSVLENDYYSLLKLPIAVLYMPMCKSLGIYDMNFK